MIAWDSLISRQRFSPSPWRDLILAPCHDRSFPYLHALKRLLLHSFTQYSPSTPNPLAGVSRLLRQPGFGLAYEPRLSYSATRPIATVPS